MSDDKREWTPKQYAMELYVRGLAVSQVQAVAMAREFEREWWPAQAERDAASREWEMLAKGRHPNITPYPEQGSEEVRETWIRAARKTINEAATKAYLAAREAS